MLKGLTWGLLGFSALAVVGMLFSPADEGTAWGILYAGLVVAQGVMTLNLLGRIETTKQ